MGSDVFGTKRKRQRSPQVAAAVRRELEASGSAGGGVRGDMAGGSSYVASGSNRYGALADTIDVNEYEDDGDEDDGDNHELADGVPSAVDDHGDMEVDAAQSRAKRSSKRSKKRKSKIPVTRPEPEKAPVKENEKSAKGKAKQRANKKARTAFDADLEAALSQPVRAEVNTEPVAGPSAAGPSSGPQRTSRSPSPKVRRSAIYTYFKVVRPGSHGTTSRKGDHHYQCEHCTEIVSFTAAVRDHSTSLRWHLKKNHGVIFKEFEAQKATMRSSKANPMRTLTERQKKMIERDAQSSKGETKSVVDEGESLEVERCEPWDQARLDKSFAKWIVANDLPLSIGEKPEFWELAHCIRRAEGPIRIPSAAVMKRRIMDLSYESFEEMKALIMDLESKVSLAVDSWTSPNGYAFLAIVMFYVSNDWELTECLIDFHHLVGEHSGSNMADAVWTCMSNYGLIDKVIAITMDNAQNNDTMMDSLEVLCNNAGITFIAKDARMRCMPHMIHIAAEKLLNGIGTISGDTAWAVKFLNSFLTESGSAGDDDYGEDDEEEEGVDEGDLIIAEEEIGVELAMGVEMAEDDASNNPTAIGKLRKIIKVIRASPQKREGWKAALQADKIMTKDGKKLDIPKMLILDVKTRWSSTYEMLRRAMDYASTLDKYVAKTADLTAHALTSADWTTINVVCGWLHPFKTATTLMSATKQPTLARVQGTFKSLMKHVSDISTALDASTPDTIRDSLSECLSKLKEYFLKSHDSPYYVWASLLDPRISTQTFEADFNDDADMLAHINDCKAKLRTLYDNYTSEEPPHTEPSTLESLGSELPTPAEDELEEYFQLAPDTSGIDPVKWWSDRSSSFPNLSRLARNVLSIPGSSVAVERIFSGGRDTVSLRRVSLKPETIKVLMLSKHKIRLERT